MTAIRLICNVLADPNTIEAIALSIEGCIGATPIVKKDRNALELTTIRTVNIYSPLSRDQVQLQIIQSTHGRLDLAPTIIGSHASLNESHTAPAHSFGIRGVF